MQGEPLGDDEDRRRDTWPFSFSAPYHYLYKPYTYIIATVVMLDSTHGQ